MGLEAVWCPRENYAEGGRVNMELVSLLQSGGHQV